MPDMLTSVHNGLVKQMVALKEKKGRSQMFLVEGIRFLEEAYNSGAEVLQVMYSQHLLETERGIRLKELTVQRGVPLQPVSEKVLGYVADTENPQGVVAAVSIPKVSLHNLNGTQGLWVVVDGIQDPGNLGTIVRTSLAAGAKGIICTKGTVDLYNPKTLRSTMGAVFKLPCLQGITQEETVEWLNLNNIPLMVADAAGEKIYYEVDFIPPIAVAIGNEGNGPSKILTEAAKYRVRIPLSGEVESLNAAVAAGLLLFEGDRQKAIVP